MKENSLKTASPSILVVDDEQSICQFFVDLFDEIGIKIDTEMTGAAGLERALKNSYALIFLDVKLGDMTGTDVLKKLKEHDTSANVVIISGYLTESLIEEALNIGVEGYLYKPLAIRDILSLTNKIIGLDRSLF